MVFFQLMRTACEVEKPRAVLESFHENRRDFGGFVFQKEFHKIAQVQIHFIAIANQIAETLIRLHRAMA